MIFNTYIHYHHFLSNLLCVKTLLFIQHLEESIIVSVNTDINIKRRLMDIGFVKGEKVKLILKNFGDNMRAYKIKNTVMALRVSDTKNILIK